MGKQDTDIHAERAAPQAWVLIWNTANISVSLCADLVGCNKISNRLCRRHLRQQVLMGHAAAVRVGCEQVQHLKRTGLILPEQYPSFTLLRQAIGATKLGYEALSLLVPEVMSKQSKQSQLSASACAGAQRPAHADFLSAVPGGDNGIGQ